MRSDLQAPTLVDSANPAPATFATLDGAEPGAKEILREAFATGLQGVKLHCHVQAFAPDSAQLHEVYEACVEADVPLLMHAGREPAVAQYPVDPYSLCGVERIERVLLAYPRLKLIVPHLGADEFDGYRRLLERYDQLWLDTTMAVADYFPGPVPVGLLQVRPERILYGTDFPNLPYAWDRELRALAKLGLGDDALAHIVGGTATKLLNLRA
jgi:uncharacterized protein